MVMWNMIIKKIKFNSWTFIWFLPNDSIICITWIIKILILKPTLGLYEHRVCVYIREVQMKKVSIKKCLYYYYYYYNIRAGIRPKKIIMKPKSP